jgi:hypothetical protein
MVLRFALSVVGSLECAATLPVALTISDNARSRNQPITGNANKTAGVEPAVFFAARKG